MIKSLSKAEAYPLIVESFKNVADELGMTKANCPGNSAFLTVEDFMKQDVTFFGLFDGDLKGCIAVERKSPQRYKIKYLAVKVSDQHKGYGRKLMAHVIEEVQTLGGKKLQLGMFKENTALYDWYLSMGFRVDKIKQYKNSDYHVCFMEYLYENIQQENQ